MSHIKIFLKFSNRKTLQQLRKMINYKPGKNTCNSCHKEKISLTHKGFLKVNNKMTSQPNRKMGKDMKRHFIQLEITHGY